MQIRTNSVGYRYIYKNGRVVMYNKYLEPLPPVPVIGGYFNELVAGELVDVKIYEERTPVEGDEHEYKDIVSEV
jgi:hypothetical protein